MSELVELDNDWHFHARPEQLPPLGKWRTWLLMGGRGSGKTRAGAEWVHALVTKQAGSNGRKEMRIALVAENLSDAREVMIDGKSGIVQIAKRNVPSYEVSRKRLLWENGAIAQVFSSEDPESLRGPQFDFAWCDELAKWRYPQETWDMLQFGLRLGDYPRQLITTTPKAVGVLRKIINAADTVTTKISTFDNQKNLAPGFIQMMQARYGGSRLGRQELDGELIEDREGGLWNRAQIEQAQTRSHSQLMRIVVAVDPPAIATAKNSCCGIIIAGMCENGQAIILKDASVEKASPNVWGKAAVAAYHKFGADNIIAEVNQGGDMVTTILKSIDPTVPVKTVRATRGKWMRAEPIAALYEQGKIRHYGSFQDLEDQMVNFGDDGLSNGRSPDRLDALVWALTALCLNSNGHPKVRNI